MASLQTELAPRRGESRNIWFLLAAVSAGVVLGGIAYVFSQRKSPSVLTLAHASDGMRLSTSCTCSETDGGSEYRIVVRNDALKRITAQATVESSEGSASSNEVTTSVPVLAKEVCLHIRIENGEFASAPEYAGGKPAAHVRLDRELIVFLGDMMPSAERTVVVATRR